MGTMRVLNNRGDTETEWRTDSKVSILKAMTTFELNKRLGYVAWKVDADGQGSERLLEFDPKATEIIFTRRLVGG